MFELRWENIRIERQDLHFRIWVVVVVEFGLVWSHWTPYRLPRRGLHRLHRPSQGSSKIRVRPQVVGISEWVCG